MKVQRCRQNQRHNTLIEKWTIHLSGSYQFFRIQLIQNYSGPIKLDSLEPAYEHIQIRRRSRGERRFSSLAVCLCTLRVPSAMNFRNQNVTDSDMSAAGIAIVPLTLLVVLVFTIPPQLSMAVGLS